MFLIFFIIKLIWIINMSSQKSVIKLIFLLLNIILFFTYISWKTIASKNVICKIQLSCKYFWIWLEFFLLYYCSSGHSPSISYSICHVLVCLDYSSVWRVEVMRIISWEKNWKSVDCKYQFKNRSEWRSCSKYNI